MLWLKIFVRVQTFTVFATTTLCKFSQKNVLILPAMHLGGGLKSLQSYQLYSIKDQPNLKRDHYFLKTEQYLIMIMVSTQSDRKKTFFFRTPFNIL